MVWPNESSGDSLGDSLGEVIQIASVEECSKTREQQIWGALSPWVCRRRRHNHPATDAPRNDPTH